MKLKVNPIFLFLFLYCALVSFRIFYNPLPFYDWDEAIYAQVGREMIEKKSLIPLWQGKYWLDKPPFIMLFYGVISKGFSFLLMPEISTRLLNLLLNLFFLVILYRFVIKVTGSNIAAYFTVFLLSFTPLFIQRVYTINMDIFLALGWLGYFYFYPNFWLSLFFAFLSVFSKSLLGFYPLLIMFFFSTFSYFSKKISLKKLIKEYQRIFFQGLILSFWYMVMFFLFGKEFFFQHIYESHIKRVILSIEFHFGERIFYFLEIYRQLNFFIFFSLYGFFLMIWFWFKKRISFKKFFQLNVFLPWFLFLNLTKTKIFWYVYPVLPQFALYFGFLMDFFQKKILNKLTKSFLFLIIIFLVSYWGLVINQFLKVEFSSKDKYYQFANFSKNFCQRIYFLPEKSHRQAIEELEKMNLTITTTKWWGGHPSLVYYTDNKIFFIYNEEEFLKKIKTKNLNDCFGLHKEDFNLISKEFGLKLLKSFNDVVLFH